MTSVVDGAPAQAVRSGVNPWVLFCGRRLLRLIVSLWVLVTFSFLIIHLVPGDAVRASLGVRAAPDIVAARRAELGLNDPLLLQYLHQFEMLFSGDLGTSLQTRLPVGQVIAERLPNTMALALISFVLILLIAIPLGLLMAVRTQNGRHRGTELIFGATAVSLSAIPDFLVAVALVALLAVGLAVLPIAGMSGALSFVIPVAALTIGPAAALARIVRVETLGVLDADYIRTARSKRLPERMIYLRHALPNAITATLTLSGLLLGGLLAGTVIVESVMAWPGLGPTLVSSIINKDFPVVQGIVMVYGVLVLVINTVVDVLLAISDPRSMIREA